LQDTVYQPLVGVNLAQEYQNGTITFTPSLADSWNVSADGSTYTFHIRPGVTFSDGNPLNSYQVWMEMYAFYYLSANSSGWLESYDVFNMNTSNFGPATISLINQSGLINPSSQAIATMQNTSWPIYVQGPSTIVFHLKSPFLYFPGTLVAFDGLIFDSQWVLQHGGFGNATTYNTFFNQNPIPGTGPYTVTSVSENSYVQFAQNPTYWGKNISASLLAQNQALDPGHAKNVIVNYKQDDVARFTDLSDGAAQLSTIQQADFGQVLGNPSTYGYTQLPSYAGLISALALNTQIYPTNITLVRLAIAHAINYSEVSKEIFSNQSAPLMGPEYPAWSQYYDLGNVPPYQFNLTLAKQEMAQANVNNATVTFHVYTSQTWQSLAQVVESNLAQIGITVNIVVSSLSTMEQYWGSYANNQHYASQIGQINILGGNGWAPGALTPADYWVSFVNNQSVFGDLAVYSNPVVQAAVNSFTSSSNVTQIQQQVQKAQTQIYSDAPYVWLGVNKLWGVSGSIVWKKGTISGFYLDCLWSGQNTAPLFNTVTFAQ